MQDKYIEFVVVPYALPQVCEALYLNGVEDFCITKYDGKLHVRWKYDINRFSSKINDSSETQSVNDPQRWVNRDVDYHLIKQSF